MAEATTKPSYDAARRIRWLMIFVVAVVAVYTAGWFWTAGQIGAAVDDAEANGADAIEWTCPGQSVRGFPLRIGVHCDRLEIASADGQYAVSGGAVRSAAVVYNPRRIVAAFESPVVVRDMQADRQYLLDWQRARSNVVTAPADERMVGFEADDARLNVDGTADIVTAERLGVYLREQDDALDIAVRPRGLVFDPALVGRRNLPALGLDIDVRLDAWQENWAASPRPQGTGTVNRLAVLLTDDRGVIADGPFELSAEGRLSGEFAVRVVDVPGVLAVLRDAFPEFATQIEALAATVPRQDGKPDDERALSLTVRDGRVFAGLIPLGRLPDLPIGDFLGL